MGLSDPIAEYVSNATGMRPSESEAAQLSNGLSTVVEKMSKMAEANGMAKIIASLSSDKQEGPSNLQQTVAVAKDLAGIQDSQIRRYQEEAKQERERTQALQAQINEGGNSNMQMFALLMKMNQDSQDRFMRMQQEHNKELEQLRQQNMLLAEKLREPAKTPQRSTIEDMLLKKTFEDLTTPGPSAAEQMMHWKQVLESMGITKDPKAIQPVANPAADLQFSLALKEIEMKQELERERMRRESEAEERRSQHRAEMLERLSPLVAMLTGGRNTAPPAQTAYQPTQAAPQQQPPLYRYKCQNAECGAERVSMEAAKGEVECPECGYGMIMVSGVQPQ